LQTYTTAATATSNNNAPTTAKATSTDVDPCAVVSRTIRGDVVDVGAVPPPPSIVVVWEKVDVAATVMAPLLVTIVLGVVLAADDGDCVVSIVIVVTIMFVVSDNVVGMGAGEKDVVVTAHLAAPASQLQLPPVCIQFGECARQKQLPGYGRYISQHCFSGAAIYGTVPTSAAAVCSGL
jgi:hypothetical protein